MKLAKYSDYRSTNWLTGILRLGFVVGCCILLYSTYMYLSTVMLENTPVIVVLCFTMVVSALTLLCVSIIASIVAWIVLGFIE